MGVYPGTDDVIAGFSGEFDAEGRYLELRFDTPQRKLSIISAYFPSGSSGEERQEAKFRFLEQFHPHLMRAKAQREFILCGDVNIAHQQIDLKKLASTRFFLRASPHTAHARSRRPWTKSFAPSSPPSRTPSRSRA